MTCMYSQNLPEAFERMKGYSRSIPSSTSAILVNKDHTKARISSRLDDVGAETIKGIVEEIEDWIGTNINSDIVDVPTNRNGYVVG